MLASLLVLASALPAVTLADHSLPAVSAVRHRWIHERIHPAVSLLTSIQNMSGAFAERVSVRWRGLPKDFQREAWIGLYLSGENLTEVVPLKYQFCNHSLKREIRSTSASFTDGKLEFNVLNYRADAVFHLFAGWEKPLLLASSQALRNLQPASPSGIHLALTGAPGEVAVTWTSTAPIVDGSHRVEFEVFADSQPPLGRLLRQGVAKARTPRSYQRQEMCGAPASAEGWRDPGTFYTAVIDQLEPGCIVRYRVGSLKAWSREAMFRTPPATGTAVRLLAFGDLGQRATDDSRQAAGEDWKLQDFSDGDPGALDTLAALKRDHESQPADMVLHNGDLSYAMGYSSVWDSFQHAIEPIASSVPWMVTMGNHERDWPASGSTEGDLDSLGECGVPALVRFPALPYASSQMPPHDQPWWTISFGAVQLVALSTEHDLSKGSPQHSFLLVSLGSVNRSRTPWVLLLGHRPYHVSSAWPEDADFPARFRAAVGDVVENNVDLILGAHHHSYQRTCAFKGERCSDRGPVVVNLGMAGAGLNVANKIQPPLFRYVDDKNFGYCRIVADAHVLTVEFVHSHDGKVYDNLTLTKPDAVHTESFVVNEFSV